MPNGGHLCLETRVIRHSEPFAGLHPDLQPGHYVMLSVTDTGCGMDAETKRRAFEPFFTTKGLGQGTGLGLATCYGIVRSCQGQIAVYSEVGRGTAFKIYLPLHADATESDRPAAGVAPDVGGCETILLVEDDNTLRKTIHRVLETRGYRVLDSTGGTDAVPIADAYGSRIDLVLSDMVMPGRSGPDTVALLLEHHPEMKVLYMSGYSDHALLRGGAAAMSINFIQKPFTPRSLAAKVRQVLDAERVAAA
jgi:CheY-like chemotaxis protein